MDRPAPRQDAAASSTAPVGAILASVTGMTEAIYQRPGDYDLEHEGDNEDVDCLVKLVDAAGPRRVLELGAGSGRLAIPLARRGAEQSSFDVVGLEPADEMRAEAERKLAAEPATVAARLRFEAGDMRSWRSPEPFDVIVCACSSVTHLLELDDQLAAWRAAFANLRPGGLFIVDVIMPHLPAYTDSLQTPPRTLLELDVDTVDPQNGARLVRYKATQYLPHEQRARIRFLYDKFVPAATGAEPSKPQAERYVSDFDSHVYFPRELQLLYLCTGFTIDALYGDYQLRPLRHGSRQMIASGRRPNDASSPAPA
jgi:SAM-dependent methyltransferase